MKMRSEKSGSSGKRETRRGGVLAVLLIVAVAFLCALSMAAYLVFKTVRVHDEGGHRVTIETPAGSLNVRKNQKLDLESVGIPIYPGATLTSHNSHGGASFEWTSNDGKAERSAAILGAEYITQDGSGQVLDFYRGKLNNWILQEKRNKEFRFEHTEGSWKRFVVITEKGNGTHIGVASIGDPAGN